MVSHARHARTKESQLARAMLRAAVTVSAAGAVVVAGCGAAGAAERPGPARSPRSAPGPVVDPGLLEEPRQVMGEGLRNATVGVLRPLTELDLNPLAKTAVDPLENVIGVQLADFKPVSTELVTKPLAEGGSVAQLPLVGDLTSALLGKIDQAPADPADRRG